MLLNVGARLGPYEIVSPIGAGGMGEVYLGRDTRLDRLVAIKTVSPKIAADPNWRERFVREARAISGLNHPHICTLHDIGNQDGVDFLVMERLEGETLADRLKRDALPLADTLRLGAQIAEALAEAHRHELIHRDIKPANIFITTRGDAKILDFGLAKTIPGAGDSEATGSLVTEFETVAGAGSGMGTVAYMSPEQLRGLPVDGRTDLFSLGIVLYEMVARARPFDGNSAVAIADAILHAAPRDFGEARVPGPLKALIRKLLEKEPANRYASASDVESELKTLQGTTTATKKGLLPRVALVAAVVTIIVIAGLAARQWQRTSRERWALGTAAPEIARLERERDYVKAAALLREAREILPADPTLEKLWTVATLEPTLTTVPPDATVTVHPYLGDAVDWQVLGKTPLKGVRVTITDYIWRIEKAGFAPMVYVGTAGQGGTLKLWPEGDVPPGMTPVQGRATNLQWPFGLANSFRPDDFLIDQHEVTNEDYKRFVDAGGYQKSEFWTEPFVRDGQTIPWDEAVATFLDRTGRPGPSTWEVGDFPKDHAKHPVGGVSWYEAAAYAKFAGRSLPTVYHWFNASQSQQYGKFMAPVSNFSGSETKPIGTSRLPTGFGTVDMAGNVKEWCSNAGSADQRFILGGGFGDADYMFNMMDAQSAWARRANYGFRTVKLKAPPPPAATTKLELVARDVWKDKIVSDELFEVFRGLYRYDRTTLNAHLDNSQTTTDWIRETISIDAAYGHERLIVHVFLPKNAAPPFQTVVYFPGAGALLSDKFNPALFTDGDRDFLLKSGRAVIAPIYKGTFERGDDVTAGGPGGNPPVLWRDHVIAWSKDLSRTLDYLETRPEFDRTRLAYHGFSLGGAMGPVMLTIEPRFKAAVLSSGGVWFMRALPEADGTNFAPRVTQPTLMLNARYDHLFPVETGQLPVFRRLGTPEKDKKHVVYDAGHGGLPHAEEVRETLDWLDKYLGPVKR
jgi:dienelactone hydrolase